jgi:DNA-binding CsgD family transcriptional regulator
MARGDDIIALVSRIHAAGADAGLWPAALSDFAKLVGGHGASLEFIERPSLSHRAMYAHGLPAVPEYLDHYAPMCPRIPFAARSRAGTVQYDGLYIDDAGMNANPFYMEFLAPYDMRNFLGGVVASSPDEFVLTGAQISPRQGHPTPAKIKLMELLLPHFQQAVDVMRRLGKSAGLQHSFERTLDWLADGVMMLAADGSVRYANVAAQKILRGKDGIAVRRGAVEFLSPDATAKFRLALQAVARLCAADVTDVMNVDFSVERRSATPPLSISIRPLLSPAREGADAVALMFIHDPLIHHAGAIDLLRQAFGLTPAEADVAHALRSGLSADAYARQRNVSANTVYTHVRRIKEKTGCTRMPELIRRLNDLRVTVVSKPEP